MMIDIKSNNEFDVQLNVNGNSIALITGVNHVYESNQTTDIIHMRRIEGAGDSWKSTLIATCMIKPGTEIKKVERSTGIVYIVEVV
jgi:hypothetical protein